MPITYDATNNIITVTGYTESVSCTFTDLYNADKAGSLQLLAPTSAGSDLSLTRQIKPADSKALKLNIIITNFSVIGTVTLTGKNKDDESETEDINITGNGTYVTTKWWKSIDAGGVDCTGTYTIEITQSRLGVVWKEGNTFQFQCRIQVGDGSTETWFADTNKQVLFKLGSVTNSLQAFIQAMANGHLRFGVLDDVATKCARDGVAFLSEEATSTTYWFKGQNIKLYSCNFHVSSTYLHYLTVGSSVFNAHIYNCHFEMTDITASYLDFYNTDMTDRGISDFRGGTLEHVKIWSAGIAFLPYLGRPMTVKNVVTRGIGYLFYPYASWVNHYAINVDADAWTLYWSWGTSTGKIYRQYEFDSRVQDKDGNAISGVSVIAEYVSPYGQAFSTTTDANGDVPTQTVDHGWFEQATGNTENLKTPLKVTYSKLGYKTVVKYYPLTEKTKDRVVLQKAVDIVFVDGRPALNLSESDHDNELYVEI